MDELQAGLIGAGAIIVAGVVAYNGWQGRRARRRLPRRAEEPEVGPLVPELHEESPFIQPVPGSRGAPAAPSAGKTGAGAARPPAPPSAPAPAAPAAPVAGGRPSRTAAAGEAAPTPQASGDGSQRREPTLGGAGFGVDLAAAADSRARVNEAALQAGGAAAVDEALGNADRGADAEPLLAGGAAPDAAAAQQAREPHLAQADAAGTGNDAANLGGSADDAARHPAYPAEPQLSAQPPVEPPPPAPPSLDADVAIIDRRIDCVVPLALSGAVAGERVAPLALRLRRAGNKQVHIEGRADDGHWEAPRAGRHYDHLRAAVQLANRAGALNELEFSEFVHGVNQLADAIDAVPSFPDMLEIVGMGRELDAFAAQCDAQLSVNVVSDGAPWSANYVQVVATQDGLLLARDGLRFVKLDAKQIPVFMLAFGDTNFVRDDLTYKGGDMITLLLDVPAADEDILPFRLMCDYARSLSQRIGGHLVDDQRRTLSQETLQNIEEQLLKIYGRLEAAGIPAGSAAARRLFSV
ncbi:cell division protein ZipA C-terminal FtsZ-binding domain-containing protein [Chitinasiproducens palmae]|uniref:Cell division protein ZipA n=1 Tax=Chitinasiproducens palmae TaxID=1770053 RepID=A0A1H2PMW8_9BURK|nr:cell division protein ZipA C-terminal FtsZ-binding domain-containing protein [Chitinasiproducens palmae]SDV47486.1 ZipA, C-terminal FtsZ-binding domain [Chitinasiproducens palmae]